MTVLILFRLWNIGSSSLNFWLDGLSGGGWFAGSRQSLEELKFLCGGQVVHHVLSHRSEFFSIAHGRFEAVDWRRELKRLLGMLRQLFDVEK